MKFLRFCYAFRFGFIGGLVFGIPSLFVSTPRWGWSHNWVLIGWVAVCAVGLILGMTQMKGLK